MSGVVTALLVASAVALLVRPATGGRARGMGVSGRFVPERSPLSRGGPLVLVTVAVLSWSLASGLVPPRVAVLACLGLGVGAAGRALVGRLVRRRARERTARDVVAACEVIAAELGAGQPPGAALASAARAWPGLGPVVEAFELGADVPSALRQLARSAPGAADLRHVAAAWQVAHTSGQGLAAAVDRVARRVHGERATRRVVESELASARATARLMAALPFAVLLLGSGAGGSPWGFLLGTRVGLACLVAGLALGAAGLWWIEVLADGVEGR